MSTVWVGKVTRHKDLVRLHLAKQLDHDIHVGLSRWVLFDASGLIKWQVEEVYMVLLNSNKAVGRTSLLYTDRSFHKAYFRCLNRALLLFV